MMAASVRLTSCLLMTSLLAFSFARPPLVETGTGNKHHVTSTPRSPLAQISRPTTADDGAASVDDRPCHNGGKLQTGSGNRKQKSPKMADAD